MTYNSRAERISHDYNLGSPFEDRFEEWTKDIGVERVHYKYSYYDFEYKNTDLKIELKTRFHAPETYATHYLRAKQLEALLKYKNALYFVGFKVENAPVSIYYLDLKLVDLAAMKKTAVKQNDGSEPIYTYEIPIRLFTRVHDRKHILEIIQEHK